jgi:hypothetical protein
MRIIAFIQDTHSIKEIMKAQGFGRELSRTGSLISELRHPSLSSSIPLRLWFGKLTTQSMKSPRTTPLSRRLMTSKTRFLCDGKARVPASRHFW